MRGKSTAPQTFLIFQAIHKELQDPLLRAAKKEAVGSENKFTLMEALETFNEELHKFKEVFSEVLPIDDTQTLLNLFPESIFWKNQPRTKTPEEQLLALGKESSIPEWQEFISFAQRYYGLGIILHA